MCTQQRLSALRRGRHPVVSGLAADAAAVADADVDRDAAILQHGEGRRRPVSVLHCGTSRPAEAGLIHGSHQDFNLARDSLKKTFLVLVVVVALRIKKAKPLQSS